MPAPAFAACLPANTDRPKKKGINSHTIEYSKRFS